METPKNYSIWIIRTYVAEGLNEIIRINRLDKKLSFQLHPKEDMDLETNGPFAESILRSIKTLPEQSKSFEKSLNDFFSDAMPSDWVLIAHQSDTIDAAGIIENQNNEGRIFQIQADNIELSVQWHLSEKVLLPPDKELRSEKLIRRYPPNYQCFDIFQYLIPHLPAMISEKIYDDEIKLRIAEQEMKRRMDAELLLESRPLEENQIEFLKILEDASPSKEMPVGQKALPALKELGGIVELFYATNRGHSGKEEANEFYTDEYVDTQFGICHVNIPKKHEVGEIERPTWWKLQFSESSERDVMLLDLHEIPKDELISTLISRMNEKDNKEALLFVHGYNNDFKQTAWRTGQVVFDLSFTGVSAFYSWPSAGDTLGYVHDLQIAQLCKPKLKEFVKLLLKTTGIKKLHIIAHSMGTYVLAGALDLLAGDAEIGARIKLIHQIILCAPDIDQREFKEQIYPRFRTIGDQRTIYASSNDKALKASDIIRKGMPRLGEGGDNLFVDYGIDTIDTSNVPTDWLGHGYFAATKELINDIFYIIKRELAPEQRNLRKRSTKDQLTYWLFPE
jgi:esterase/lipase superfamily enzyme